MSYPRCHYIKRFTRNLVWLRGTGKLYDNSKNVLDSEKNTPSFFLINYRRCLIPTRYLSTLVTTVLQYPSELESKLTRKLFAGFDLHGNLGRQAIMKPKTTPKRKTTTTEGQRNKNMLWGDKSKSRSSRSSFSKRAPTVIFILGKVPIWKGGREGGDSKGRVINKKHTMLGESNLICM